MCQYLENCRRCVQSYYLWLIVSCICAFDWHQDRWPWTREVWIFIEFLRISQISDATTAKPMKVDQCCQRQRCKHVELEQFLACFRVARVCQWQLGFLVQYCCSVMLQCIVSSHASLLIYSHWLAVLYASVVFEHFYSLQSFVIYHYSVVGRIFCNYTYTWFYWCLDGRNFVQMALIINMKLIWLLLSVDKYH